jgi:Ras-related protein Rab-3C
VKAVFERLVDIICDKMAESLDADPSMMQQKGTRLAPDANRPPQQQCNC